MTRGYGINHLGMGGGDQWYSTTKFICVDLKLNLLPSQSG